MTKGKKELKAVVAAAAGNQALLGLSQKNQRGRAG